MPDRTTLRCPAGHTYVGPTGSALAAAWWAVHQTHENETQEEQR